jgi:hypothetical protein
VIDDAVIGLLPEPNRLVPNILSLDFPSHPFQGIVDTLQRPFLEL